MDSNNPLWREVQEEIKKKAIDYEEIPLKLREYGEIIPDGFCTQKLDDPDAVWRNHYTFQHTEGDKVIRFRVAIPRATPHDASTWTVEKLVYKRESI